MRKITKTEEIIERVHIGLPVFSGRFRTVPNEKVDHVYTKQVNSTVVFKNGMCINLGVIVEKDGVKGIVIELDDAKIIDYFIKIWWSNKSEPKWCSLKELSEENITMDGRLFDVSQAEWA